jgi:CysZ protein
MFKTVRAFSQGPKYHLEGIKFGFKNPYFLAMAALPFFVTLFLYVFGFYLFNAHVDSLLDLVWQVNPGESSKLVGWLHWSYTHIVKFFIYIIALAVMFYTFVVCANVLASPVYDHISEKYQRMFHSNQASSSTRGILTIMKEEMKKAVFMLIIPLILLFIPVIGSFLGFVVAAVFIAWDFVDFSLARDCPLFRDRMKTLWKHKFRLMGFGVPLLVPFVGIMVLPFAILGSTKLYYDTIYETH